MEYNTSVKEASTKVIVAKTVIIINHLDIWLPRQRADYWGIARSILWLSSSKNDWLIDDHLYSAILRSLEQTHCARLWFYMSDKLFIARFLNIHRSGVLTALAWLVPHETAAISAQVLCTPYNHAQCHFMQSHIRKVYACLAVTCHLHFWRNDRDLLHATAVTRGWNAYRN